MATATRAPTSDESVTGAWTGSVGLRYTLVDDYPDTVPSDVLDSPTATGGAQITFGFSAFSIPAGSTGISVQVQYYDRDVTSGNNNAGARLKVGGSYFNSATHNPTTTLTAQSNNFATNPKTTVAWTVDDINGVGANALQAFGFNSTDASPALRFSSVRLQVTYTPPAFSLTVADAAQTQAADEVVLTAHVPTFTLVIQDAGQGQAVDTLTLVAHDPTVPLIIEDASQLQNADNTALTQHNILSIADASQLHSAENTTLTQHNILSIADASQLHSADNTSLTQHNILSVADASQLQNADHVTLTAHLPGLSLTIQDTTHIQSADTPSLTQHNVLSIDGAGQLQAAGSPTLTYHGAPEGPSYELTIQDALQEHSAEQIDLIAHFTSPVLAIQDCTQQQTADELEIEAHDRHGPGPVAYISGSYSEWDFPKTENWW